MRRREEEKALCPHSWARTQWPVRMVPIQNAYRFQPTDQIMKSKESRGGMEVDR